MIAEAVLADLRTCQNETLGTPDQGTAGIEPSLWNDENIHDEPLTNVLPVERAGRVSSMR